MLEIFFKYFHYVRVKLGLNRKRKLYNLIKHHKPESILEIGVDEGKNAIIMIAIMNKHIPQSKIHYTGVDLFLNMMNAEIARREASQIPKLKNDVSILIKKNFPEIDFELIEGDSNIKLNNIDRKFDLILIDGGHSFKTVSKDFELCEKLLNKNGIIVLDDYTNRNSELKAGYGVRSFVDKLDRKKYEIKINKFPDFFYHEWGMLVTRMVIVKLKS